MAAGIRNFRSNSLRICIGVGRPMPTDKEVFRFFEQVGFEAASLLAMYKEMAEYSVYAKFKSNEEMEIALAKVKGGAKLQYENGESVLVTVTVATGRKLEYVRLFGLPPDVENSEIKPVLMKYGEIVRMVRERYANETGYPIWNGVRGVYMEVVKELPSSIHVLHFQTRVYYEGFRNRCFICHEGNHLKAECPTRKNVNERMNRIQQATTVGKERLAEERDSSENKDEPKKMELETQSSAERQVTEPTLTEQWQVVTGRGKGSKRVAKAADCSGAAAASSNTNKAVETRSRSVSKQRKVENEVVTKQGKSSKRAAITKSLSSESSDGGVGGAAVSTKMATDAGSRSKSKQRRVEPEVNDEQPIKVPDSIRLFLENVHRAAQAHCEEEKDGGEQT